jgi:hypothetical protein
MADMDYGNNMDITVREPTELESLLTSLARGFSTMPLRPLYTCHTAEEMDSWWMKRNMQNAEWVRETANRALRLLSAKAEDPPALSKVTLAGWSIERAENDEILVVAPTGNGMHVANQGTLAQRLLYELAQAAVRVDPAHGLSGETWSAVTKRCFDTGGNSACADVSASRCTICPNRKAATGVEEKKNG